MSLPLLETRRPESLEAVAPIVREAIAARMPLYPLGGACSVDFGLPARAPGWAVSTAGLTRIVDYPARDMTITVEAGLPLARLAETLAAERQRLPIDMPQAEQATVGGWIATNYSGPRRYGAGTLRDYVIGITAVDGHATEFHAGGRVVKNVAGYDLCKLLTGSLGTLAIITQVTLKVRPLPETTAWVVAPLENVEHAAGPLAALVTSSTTPSAVELVAGSEWRDLAGIDIPATGAALAVAFEGTEREVLWQVDRLREEWATLGIVAPTTLVDAPAAALWRKLVDADGPSSASLVLKASVVPSRVVDMFTRLRAAGPGASLQAHAGSGQIIARYADWSLGQAARRIVQQLQPAASSAGGSLIVWSTRSTDELTRQVVWGPNRGDLAWMQAVRQQFDPHGLLNPGRFVYP